MDILLILYSILLTGILVTPFLYIHLNENKVLPQESELKSSLDSERKMLLENLRDLKIEMDTGKIQSSEFSELSQDIIEDLKQLDNKILSMENIIPANDKLMTCNKCNFLTSIPNAKFCAMCGNSLLRDIL